MRKTQRPVKAKSRRKPGAKKAYTRPELAKREKLIGVTGSVPPVVT